MSPHDNGQLERNVGSLAGPQIQIRLEGVCIGMVWGVIEKVKREFACVCVCLSHMSGSLCLACYRQPPSSCPGDGCALVWMFHGSHGCHSTFPTLSPSLSFSFYLYQAGTEFTHLPVRCFVLAGLILPVVLSGFFPIHLSHECVMLEWTQHLEQEC